MLAQFASFFLSRNWMPTLDSGLPQTMQNPAPDDIEEQPTQIWLSELSAQSQLATNSVAAI
jgi:hypothetical protein